MGELVHDALKVRKLDKKICNMSKKMSEKRNLNGSAMAGGAAASDTAKTNRTRSVFDVRATAHAPETRVTTNGNPEQNKTHAARKVKTTETKNETTNQLHHNMRAPSPSLLKSRLPSRMESKPPWLSTQVGDTRNEWPPTEKAKETLSTAMLCCGTMRSRGRGAWIACEAESGGAETQLAGAWEE